jgi:hypothetical protein
MSQEKLWFEGRRWLDQARDDLEAAELWVNTEGGP